MSETALPFRLRVRYAKRGRLIYLGHLEVIHTIERIVRRAGLPYAVTQGFSPRMKAGFTSALPVGTGSTCEWYDLFLTDHVDAGEALRRLAAATPADLAPCEAAYVDARTPALTAQITRVTYRVALTPLAGLPLDARAVERALEVIRASGSISYLRGRKEKVLDLDRTLAGLSVKGIEDGAVSIELDTRCDNEGALRPEILLAALDRALLGGGAGEADGGGAEEGPIVSTGIQDARAFARYDVTRCAQLIALDDGSLVDPLGGPWAPWERCRLGAGAAM